MTLALLMLLELMMIIEGDVASLTLVQTLIVISGPCLLVLVLLA